jgi:Uma2 family endonuclease
MALSATPISPVDLEVDVPDVSGIVTTNDAFSERQKRMLIDALYNGWSAAGVPPVRFVALTNVGLIHKPDVQPVVPDFLLSLDAALPDDRADRNNRSYFIWNHGKAPEVVVEIVSNAIGGELTEKFERYQWVRVPYYVVFDPLRELGDLILRTYEMRGGRYVSVERPWFEGVGLGLVEWEGQFEGAAGRWLRWCTRDGSLLPTGAERALEAEARAERLLAKLRAAGIDPNGDG